MLPSLKIPWILLQGVGDVLQSGRNLLQIPVIVAFTFMILGIMVKAAIFPLHIWLPNAYAYAPSPVSILLAATATKVAIYILVRITFTIFGPSYDLYSFEVLRYILLFLSIVAMFAGTVMAIFEKDVKKLLAHSSVAQIGYIILGISLATEIGIASGFIHLINHALIKAGLFMSGFSIFNSFLTARKYSLDISSFLFFKRFLSYSFK